MTPPAICAIVPTIGLLLLDDDVVLEPGCVEAMVDVIVQRLGAGNSPWSTCWRQPGSASSGFLLPEPAGGFSRLQHRLVRKPGRLARCRRGAPPWSLTPMTSPRRRGPLSRLLTGQFVPAPAPAFLEGFHGRETRRRVATLVRSVAYPRG